MPNWSSIVLEIQQSAAERGADGPDVDGILLKYVQRLQQISGRAVILYASGWLRSGGQDTIDHTVEGSDVHGFMEACHKVPERDLDLIIHSPGGSPTAAEQIVNYLRSQFDHIRALVPMQAKSAATMMALGCDEIVMGLHSELGPIDPQIGLTLPGGANRLVPAHAILRDFDRAQKEIAADLTKLPAWTPILHTYAGGLLDYCTQQIALSQEVVAGWLEHYMLSSADANIPESDRKAIAATIAEHFGSTSSYDRFRTHGRPMRVEELETIPGLRMRRLETDDDMQDALLSIYHVLDFIFSGPCLKIISNHMGARYVRVRQQLILQAQPPTQPAPPNNAGQRPQLPSGPPQRSPTRQYPKSTRKNK